MATGSLRSAPIAVALLLAGCELRSGPLLVPDDAPSWGELGISTASACEGPPSEVRLGTAGLEAPLSVSPDVDLASTVRLMAMSHDDDALRLVLSRAGE